MNYDEQPIEITAAWHPGNTRINGVSEGLKRGAKLTGRINRAESLGEQALRENGSAFGAQKRNDQAAEGLAPAEKKDVENGVKFKPGDKVRHKKDRSLVGKVESVRPFSGGADTVTVDWERNAKLTYGAITQEDGDELELANAGDDGFIGADYTGMVTDDSAQTEDAGAEIEIEPLANSKKGLRRGAAKYGTKENASFPRFKIGDKIKAHGKKAKVVGVNDQNKYGGKDHSYEVEKPDGVREVWWEDEVSPGIF